ncbi:MAG: 3-phosphoglycerate dehydrogenase [Spirochaetes bacterium]|nr:MAG: 3-phosphoglycerate dehydrogenase [Spirochaetota bacterium]
MFKIQTRNKISPIGLNLFNPDEYEVADTASAADALLLRSYKLPENEIETSVKTIARAGAGVNNIPVDACTDRGIVVFNTPGANANSVKELVIAGMLLSARRIHQGLSWIEGQAADENLAKTVEKEKSKFAGTEISGKKLGVIGLGAIGGMVANAAVSLGMEVHGYDPYISCSGAWNLSRTVIPSENLNKLLEICDFVSVHVPLLPATRNLINAENLKNAKAGLRVLNFARGGLVEEAAIKKALEEGIVSHYITDFPSPELLGVEGVLSIPHLGASTAEAEENCAVMAANQLMDFLKNGNIKNSVNFPACTLESAGGPRLIAACKSNPEFLKQVLAILSENGAGTGDMMSKERGDISYIIINLSGSPLSDSVMDKISALEGSILTRQL